MAAEAQRPLPLGVTIAVVDGGRGLPRAVDAALAGVRVLADWAIPAEVLLVGRRPDDDGQVLLLRQLEALYYGQGLRLFLHAARPGADAARTLALPLAAYRYVACLSGRDELVPDVLPLFYRAMRDTSAAVVCGNLIVHRPDGVILINNDNPLGRLPQEPDTLALCALWDRLQLDHAGGLEDGQALPAAAEPIVRLVASGRRLVFVPVVFGHHYPDPGAWTAASPQRHPAYPPRSQRAFDQADQREPSEHNSQFLRYHPDLGYL